MVKIDNKGHTIKVEVIHENTWIQVGELPTGYITEIIEMIYLSLNSVDQSKIRNMLSLKNEMEVESIVEDELKST